MTPMLHAVVPDLFAISLVLGLLGLAAVHDVEDLRIPNRISLAIAALYPVHVLASPVAVDWLGAVSLSGAVFAGGFALFAFGLMGGGDVKLLAVSALWAGTEAAFDFLLATAVVGGALSLLWTNRFRLALAMSFDAVGGDRFRDLLLGTAVPYGVAVALGGFLAIGPMLVTAWGLGLR